MKFKGFRYDIVYIALTFAAAAAFCALTAMYYSVNFAIAFGSIFFIIFIYGTVRAFLAKEKYKNMLKTTTEKLDYSDNKVLSEIPVPVAVCNENGNITWANSLFIESIAHGNISELTSMSSIIGEEFDGSFVGVDDDYYILSKADFISGAEKYTVYKFTDCTELKQAEILYKNTRPYVLIAQTDNIDENSMLLRDSEKTEMKSKVEGMMDAWSDRYNSLMKRISDDRTMIITEKSNIDKMIEDKFSIIESIRKSTYKEKNINVTLSIGCASGDTIKHAEKLARKALDMALSRGGDQAAVLGEDGNYTFFGGVSKSADTKYRIKSRLWASQLLNMIQHCSRVFVIGHKYSDFDSFASSCGIAYACDFIGVKSNIVIDKKTTLAEPLLSDFLKSEYGELVISPSEAIKNCDENSMLILCDTHLISGCDCPELFDKTEHIAVIDHHRLNAGVQTDIYLFAHNPNASSASEMVTEIIQYITGDETVPVAVAQALLAGIMLDTKNFVLNSGVRTFEAAAFLKSNKADVVKVSKYFYNSPETIKAINLVILNSIIYNGFAISTVDEDKETQNKRLLASKSADEMLKADGIKASFVLFKEDEYVCISARSLGEINVQLIMEALGGGGHQNMAACKIKTDDMNQVENLLKKELNNITEI